MDISVLIPAYNSGAYLLDALATIERQTRLPDQVIIVDDGSSDDTFMRAMEWAENSTLNGIVIKKENGGVSTARNTALERCGTALAAFMDSDDLLMPEHLETLQRPFENDPDLAFAFGDQQEFNEAADYENTFHAGKAFLDCPYEERENFRHLTADVFPYLAVGNFVSTSASMVRMSAVKSSGPFDVTLPTAEDREFFLRLSRQGGVAYTRRVLARKRMHDSSLTEAVGDLNVVRNGLLLLANVVANPDRYAIDPQIVSVCRDLIRQDAKGLIHGSSHYGLASMNADVAWVLETTGLRITPSIPERLRALYRGIVRLPGAS